MNNFSDNFITKIYRTAKQLIVYQPPQQPTRFVLGETQQNKQKVSDRRFSGIKESLTEFYKLISYAKRLAAVMEEGVRILQSASIKKSFPSLKRLCTSLEKQQSEVAPLLLAYNEAENDPASMSVSASLAENEKNISRIYRLPYNTDLIIRKFNIPVEPVLQAMLVYIEGLCDSKTVNHLILKPLMLYSRAAPGMPDDGVLNHLITQYLPSGKTTSVMGFSDIQNAVNTGDAALFIEGEPAAILIEGKGWEHRSVDRPIFEQSVRGAQTGFGEVLGVNIALVRSLFNASDLVAEKLTVGIKSKTVCVVMYLESVANPALVNEIKRRITGVETDCVTDISILEQFIADHPHLPLPTALNTERPDRVAAGLNEGRVAILLDSSPFALIAPVSLFSLLHSGEDFALLHPYSSLIRLIRWTGVVIALLLPALFLAISNFHQEAIPTEMLLSITSARLQVPFPTILEMLLLGVAFELIREGGLRIPGFLGPTIGIVGGIILGQAAVSAKIVSPIMVIVVAATGVASYTIPDYRLSAAVRMASLALMLFSAVMGLVGIATGLLIMLAVLCNMKSYGMPYLSPVVPKSGAGLDVIIRGPVYHQEMRPDALNTKVSRRQPHRSRVWRKQKPDGGETE
ncbi:spore germination protein [Sporomusa acidovorans]|uniref:Spore germination protein B1 n=1 Tax=Sporomusa acidovorans (strain ATCC 49682 / DSM 3132 / Mol) TaxID=1123286 RepID=A0ABZ3J6Q9_SPOA4|nr:spore germination protein [Sporomusa acidovorans]OZC15409.1 spore germination protein B1 [Sporomusa acidovorans DSM 3132]SDF13174.1 spore germination protein KA [Sporomusa acidovorans]